MAAGAQAIADAFGQSGDGNAFGIRLDIAWTLPLGIALQMRVDGLQDVVGAERATADIGVNIVRPRQAQLPENPFDALVAQLIAFIDEGLFENLASERDMLVTLRVAKIAADFRAGATRHDEALPERRRRLLLGANDLDLIAVLQRRVQ